MDDDYFGAGFLLCLGLLVVIIGVFTLGCVIKERDLHNKYIKCIQHGATQDFCIKQFEW